MSTKPPKPQVTTVSNLPVVPPGGEVLGQRLLDIATFLTSPSSTRAGGPGEEGLDLPFNIGPQSIKEGLGLDKLTVGLSPEEEALRQSNIGRLLTRSPEEQAGINPLMISASGGYLNPETNPYLAQTSKAITTSSNENLYRNLARSKDEAFQAGAGGGSRQALREGEAIGTSQRALDEIIANLFGENLARERGLQTTASKDLLDYSNVPIERGLKAETLAGIPRELEQSETDKQINDYLRQQEERLIPLEVSQGLLGQRMGTPSSFATPGGSSTFSQVGSFIGNVGKGISSVLGGGS